MWPSNQLSQFVDHSDVGWEPWPDADPGEFRALVQDREGREAEATARTSSGKDANRESGSAGGGHDLWSVGGGAHRIRERAEHVGDAA